MQLILALFIFSNLIFGDESHEPAAIDAAEQHRLVVEEHKRLHAKTHEDAVAAARSNAEKRHANLPGETVTHTHTATVETVHTEVKDTATNEIISNKITIDKIEKDDDGVISESHFEAHIERDDDPPAVAADDYEVEDEPDSPKLAQDEKETREQSTVEDAGPDTDYQATPPPTEAVTIEWSALVAYCIVFAVVISYAVHSLVVRQLRS